MNVYGSWACPICVEQGYEALHRLGEVIMLPLLQVEIGRSEVENKNSILQLHTEIEVAIVFTMLAEKLLGPTTSPKIG